MPSKQTKTRRPLFPNHEKKCSTVRDRLRDWGLLNYRANVLEKGREAGMKLPIMTLKQSKNKYTKYNMYGLELEVTSDHPARELYNYADYPFFICKDDSSISGMGDHHSEVVSVPMTLKAHKILWTNWLNNIDKKSTRTVKIDTSPENNNGIHIHVDMENFIDTRHRRNFIWFFNNPAHMGLLFDISERNNWQEIRDYAQPRISDPQNGSRWITKSSGKPQIFKDLFSVTSGRGITASRSATIEVRLFKGIPTPETIIKALEFVDSVVEFTKERSWIQINFKRYMEWLFLVDDLQAEVQTLKALNPQDDESKEKVRVRLHAIRDKLRDNNCNKNRWTLIKKFLTEYLHDDSWTEYELINYLFENKDIVEERTFVFREDINSRRTQIARRLIGTNNRELQHVSQGPEGNTIVVKRDISRAGRLSDTREQLYSYYVLDDTSTVTWSSSTTG